MLAFDTNKGIQRGPAEIDRYGQRHDHDFARAGFRARHDHRAAVRRHDGGGRLFRGVQDSQLPAPPVRRRAFSQAFVPVFSEYKSQRDHAQVRRLADEVTGTLGALLFGVTLIGVIAAPLLIMLFAPGFLADAHKYDLTVEMLRITFPYLLFVSLTALAGAYSIFTGGSGYRPSRRCFSIWR